MNTKNGNGPATGLIIGVIVVALLGIAAYAFLSQDDTNESFLPEEDTLIPDDQDVATSTTDNEQTLNDANQNLSTIEENLTNGNIDAVVGVAFAAESAVITQSISDRLFRISSPDQKGGDGVLIYLDEPAITDLAAGEEITISGTFVEDLEGRTLNADETAAVEAEQAILLVTDVEIAADAEAEN